MEGESSNCFESSATAFAASKGRGVPDLKKGKLMPSFPFPPFFSIFFFCFVVV